MESKNDNPWNLKFVKVIPSSIDINRVSQRTYGVLESAGQITQKNFISTSFDNSQIVINATPPSERVFISRRINIQARFRLTFTGTSGGAGQTLLQCSGLPFAPGVNPGNAQYDAPRCLPFSSACRSVNVQINNDSVATNLSSYSRILQRYQRGPYEENHDLSGSPAMPDKSQSYDELIGFNLNPLAGYGDNVLQCPRGGFVGARVIRNDSTGAPGDIAIVELTINEPIFISPFQFSTEDEPLGLIGVQNMDFLFQLAGRGTGPLSGLISALWSHAPGSPTVFSAIEADVLSAQAQLTFSSPPLMMSVPKEVCYSYFEPNLFSTTSFSPVLAGDETTLFMNTVNLKSVPNRVYVWVSQRDSDVNVTSTDTYFSISNLNVTFGNQDGIMSNASQYELYQISRANGLNISWTEFLYKVGSVLCISMGDDVPLGPLQAPGLRENTSLSLQVVCRNISALQMIPTLQVLVIMEGVMCISNQSVYRSVGVLNPSDVLDTSMMPTGKHRKSKNFYGSSFWDQVKGLFSAKSLKKAAQAGLDLAEVIPGPYQGIAHVANRAIGSSLGGRGLSQQELKSLMR